jgi:hypothetical protein
MRPLKPLLAQFKGDSKFDVEIGHHVSESSLMNTWRRKAKLLAYCIYKKGRDITL